MLGVIITIGLMNALKFMGINSKCSSITLNEVEPDQEYGVYQFYPVDPIISVKFCNIVK